MHITVVVEYDSPQVDIDWLIRVEKRHTSFQCSMIVMQLTGIVDLDAMVQINPGAPGNNKGGEISLSYILPHHFHTKDGESPLFAEVHQCQAHGPVEAVRPRAKLAEVMIMALNKHMAGFLKHFVIDRGLIKDLVTRLVAVACCPNQVAELNKVTWDSDNQEINTVDKKDDDARLADFEKEFFLRRY